MDFSSCRYTSAAQATRPCSNLSMMPCNIHRQPLSRAVGAQRLQCTVSEVPAAGSIISSRKKATHHSRDRHLCCGVQSAFGSSSDKSKEGTAFDDQSSEQDEVVLVETVRADGSAAQIVYRTGAPVSAGDLEQLCGKVGWPARPLNKVQAALDNSFLVCSLVLRVHGPSSSSDGADAAAASSNGASAAPSRPRVAPISPISSMDAYDSRTGSGTAAGDDETASSSDSGISISRTSFTSGETGSSSTGGFRVYTVGPPKAPGSSSAAAAAAAALGSYMDIGPASSVDAEDSFEMYWGGGSGLSSGPRLHGDHITALGPVVSETLVGLARATSDSAFNATIWDVLVDPEYQGQGLGKAMVEHMVKALLRRDISAIALFADPNVVEFYGHAGFEAEPRGVKAMFWYPKSES